MKNIIPSKYKTVLFHLCLWSLWLYLPLSNSSEQDTYSRFLLISILVVTTHIPLFFFNTNWLFPRIFPQKGRSAYLGALILSILIFGCIHYIVKDWALTYLVYLPNRHPNPAWNIIPLILVSAISTGYALLDYIAKEEQVNQEKQQERLQSELSFLRSQISPHFIFNVLNSIVYLIRTKSDLAETVIIKLSELMRYMLYDSGHAQISLQKELTYLANYIALQNIRFEEDVKIHLNIQGDATAQIIEPMLMIPFVENAFKHGVGMVLDPEINVDVQVTATDLVFSVRNKIAPETIENKEHSTGIGLGNVRRRLELLYPNAHDLTINRTENSWYEVHLRLKLLDPIPHAS